MDLRLVPDHDNCHDCHDNHDDDRTVIEVFNCAQKVEKCKNLRKSCASPVKCAPWGDIEQRGGEECKAGRGGGVASLHNIW